MLSPYGSLLSMLAGRNSPGLHIDMDPSSLHLEQSVSLWKHTLCYSCKIWGDLQTDKQEETNAQLFAGYYRKLTTSCRHPMWYTIADFDATAQESNQLEK